MPRKKLPPRLYFDRTRHEWVVRDGQGFHRTGCAETDIAETEAKHTQYLRKKWKPESGPDPLIADVLNVYAQEHLSQGKHANNLYCVSSLARWWGHKRLSDVSARSCREYAD